MKVINPSALNVIIIGASMILFTFVWRMSAAWIEERNSTAAGAMGAAL